MKRHVEKTIQWWFRAITVPMMPRLANVDSLIFFFTSNLKNKNKTMLRLYFSNYYLITMYFMNLPSVKSDNFVWLLYSFRYKNTA